MIYEPLKKLILKFLKVPPEPDDPMGDVNSLKVFRASPNYFRYRFYLWLIANSFAIIFSLVIGIILGGMVLTGMQSIAGMTLGIITGALVFLIVMSLLLVHLVISYTILRLDYEMRWYKISDRSLRIREGVVHVKELSMTFANIQNISISQGPIQRFFKIADLKVETAGGGGSVAETENDSFATNMHIAYFRGVDNAEEIRELMRVRLKKLLNAGLGDHDDSDHVQDAGIQKIPALLPEFKEMLTSIHNEAKLFRMAAEKL
jgi:uncharacterized membrane protein YdbT with pleckstrin-like domain